MTSGKRLIASTSDPRRVREPHRKGARQRQGDRPAQSGSFKHFYLVINGVGG
jgi:hypothetical protein